MSRLRRPVSVLLSVALAALWLTTSTTPVAASPTVTSTVAAVPALALMEDDWTWTKFGAAVYGGAAGGAVRGMYAALGGPVALVVAGGTGVVTGALVGAVAYAATYVFGRAFGGDEPDTKLDRRAVNADLLLD